MSDSCDCRLFRVRLGFSGRPRTRAHRRPTNSENRYIDIAHDNGLEQSASEHSRLLAAVLRRPYRAKHSGTDERAVVGLTLRQRRISFLRIGMRTSSAAIGIKSPIYPT